MRCSVGDARKTARGSVSRKRLTRFVHGTLVNFRRMPYTENYERV